MLLLSNAEGRDNFTMLHEAAWHGSEHAVRELLRMGANAAQPNALGQSAADVAAAQQHEAVARMLRTHSQIWKGWGVVELSCLACLYHEDRFVDSDAYLQLLRRWRDKAGLSFLVLVLGRNIGTQYHFARILFLSTSK